MPSARYRLLSPGGQAREDGDADVSVAAGTFVLAPETGAVLRVPAGAIATVDEPQPFTVRITLADGTAVELSRLGAIRTQFLAELSEARGDTAAKAGGAVGSAEIFTAIGGGGGPVEVRVYEDALMVNSGQTSERVSFSFVRSIVEQDYTVILDVAGREPLVLSRLGRRTGEFAHLLHDRDARARGRTAAFLGSLLPGLDPMALREVAGRLRDGVAVPLADLNAIDPELGATLLDVAVLPARREPAAELARRASLAIGFKQTASVRRAASGVTAWQDSSAPSHIGDHDTPYARGPASMIAASMLSGGPNLGPGSPGGAPMGFDDGYAFYGELWAFRALGAPVQADEHRTMSRRANVTRGRLVPASEDLSALAVTGKEPTVLAFALGYASGRVIFEVLNRPEPPTFVYADSVPGTDGSDVIGAVNRALDDCGFTPGALARPLAGQIPHGAQWSSQLAALLAGGPGRD